MRDFRELKVWSKGHRLTLDVYKATIGFPREEKYGLTSQIRRSASSIPANMAEGCGRSGDAELSRFMLIAMGSASELEYHLLLARDLGFLEGKDHERLSEETTEIKRMLSKFINKLRESVSARFARQHFSESGKNKKADKLKCGKRSVLKSCRLKGGTQCRKHK